MILHKEQPQVCVACRRSGDGGKSTHFRTRISDGRQLKPKGCAFAQASAGGGERAAVRFGDRSANRKAEPEAPDPLFEQGLGLEERVEDARQRLRLNSEACIAKLDSQIGSLIAVGFDDYLSTRGRELDSILDQVPEDLLEPAGISIHKVPRRIELDRELEF